MVERQDYFQVKNDTFKIEQKGINQLNRLIVANFKVITL